MTDAILKRAFGGTIAVSEGMTDLAGWEELFPLLDRARPGLKIRLANSSCAGHS